MRMVQRKLVDKLGIQADHVESKGSSPSWNQCNKNEGAADLKKTMQKSRTLQHSDFQSLRSTPPLRSKDSATSDHVKTRAATPQRQSPGGSPNYMKPTSSFDARRSMSLMKLNNSRRSSGTSSLKVVRTLLKTPSLKKYSPVALCEDFDVRKPTCSTTLKDSKMPVHLELSSGGTESVGTSAMKVCPYTYCSLNGHHHAPLPPLKRFVSEKRRVLKAQKVIKLGSLSPHRSKPSRERMVKIDAKQVILADIPESLSSTAPGFVIDFEGNLEADKDQNVELGAKVHPFPATQEDEILDCLGTLCNTDDKSQQISQHGQSDSEAWEMELKEGHHYEPSLDDVSSLKLKETDMFNGSNIESVSNSNDNTNNSYEDILTDEVRVGFYDERSVSSNAWSDDGESDLDGSYHDMDLGNPYLACDGKCESVETLVRENSVSHPIEEFQATSIEKSEVPEASTGEEDGTCESVQTRVNENSISHPMEEFQATSVRQCEVPEASGEIPKMNFQLGSEEIKCSTGVEEVVLGPQGDEAVKQEHVSWLLYQDSIEDASSNDLLNESFLAKTTYEDAAQEDLEEKISATDARDGMEEKEPPAAESFDGIPTFDSLRENEQEKPIADATEGMERKEKVLAGHHFVGSQPFELLQELPECITVNEDRSKQTADETLPYESNDVESHEFREINQDQLQTCEFKSSKIFEDQMHSGPAVLKATPNQNQEADTGEGESRTEPEAAETSITAKASAITQKRDQMSNANRASNEEMTQIAATHLSWTTGSRKTAAELEDVRDFNPREPNFLPEEPDLEPEKVDLRHQLMDERKNSEEWMVDYALRQAVTKLAPARSRKVTLLVEAFEKVLPTPKCETRPSHTSSAFIHARTIPTCR